MSVLASLPSPPQGVWYLGPVPIRAYAVAIVVGIAVAIWVGSRRWVARGGNSEFVGDVAMWAVPFGLVGARVYHVVSDWEPYFGADGDPLRALQIWHGGLGIWGAIAFGALGAWIACRRAGVRLPAFADALAPGIVLAQAIGRWGNWFNQELYGRPTDLPWGLRIDEANREIGFADVEAFHPTFLYESLWCVGVAVVVVVADRRFRLGHGRAFALYVAAYTLGRAWIEELRIDPAHEVLGMRLNLWTSAVVFLAAVLYLVISAKRRPGREEPSSLWTGPAQADGESDQGSDTTEDAEHPDATDQTGAEPAEETAHTHAAATAEQTGSGAGEEGAGGHGEVDDDGDDLASSRGAANDGPSAGEAESDR